MSSPPSLQTLKLSSTPSADTPDERPSSPSTDVEATPNGNGVKAADFAPSPATTSPDAAPPTVNGNVTTETAASLTTGGEEPKVNGDAAAPSPTSTASASRPVPSGAASTPAVPTSRAAMGLAGRPGVGGAARGGMAPMGMRGARGGQPMQARLPPSLQAKMELAAARGGVAPQPQTGLGPNPNATSMAALLRSQALGGGAGGGAGGGPAGLANAMNRPGPASGPLGLAARRAPGGMPRPNLGSMGSAPGGMQRGPGVAGRRMGPPGGLNLSSMGGGAGGPAKADNKFTDFNKIMDPSGSLKFSSKAVLTAKGVEFEDGASFKINMDEMEIVGELGKGNYGSVQQVYHRPSEINMAMKEIRLELDESKLNGIIMELDVLHRAVAPEIVEFYGAFTIESCVYYCMEFMDAGSLDTLTGGGVPLADAKADGGEEGCALRVPEPVLRRITAAMVRGLKFLKDELQIMHRDVKPTNVLINKKGEVKLVDFGVSGQLEKSLAKTNIGCQSYMAPERIKGESQNQPSTYTVSSDVWSVGLSIIELAKGCYPFPPETFANVFAQLQAIVYGPAPVLPPGYSKDAQDFVAKCLIKDANGRPTYAQLLEHPFLAADKDAEVDMAGWVAEALERRAARGIKPLALIEA